MSKNIPTKFMMPFFPEEKYEWFPHSQLMVFGRVKDDFQQNCALFSHSRNRHMNERDVAELRKTGKEVCYVYDMLDLENREFTREGFRAINADFKRAISNGFTHVLLSNAYIIELACNEYAKDIKVVASGLLECNSPRFKTFFDVLNDSKSVSHIVISQNHLTQEKMRGLKEVFSDKALVVEADRWASDIQMVHEHYYNMSYGYFSEDAVEELKRFSADKNIQKHVKPSEKLLLKDSSLVHKFGEINVSHTVWKQNVRASLAKRPKKISIIDFALW